MKQPVNLSARFHLIFNLIMVVLYAFAGVLLIFILRFEQIATLNIRLVGGVLLLYAVYRGYKLYREYSQRREDAEEEQ